MSGQQAPQDVAVLVLNPPVTAVEHENRRQITRHMSSLTMESTGSGSKPIAQRTRWALVISFAIGCLLNLVAVAILVILTYTEGTTQIQNKILVDPSLSDKTGVVNKLFPPSMAPSAMDNTVTDDMYIFAMMPYQIDDYPEELAQTAIVSGLFGTSEGIIDESNWTDMNKSVISVLTLFFGCLLTMPLVLVALVQILYRDTSQHIENNPVEDSIDCSWMKEDPTIWSSQTKTDYVPTLVTFSSPRRAGGRSPVSPAPAPRALPAGDTPAPLVAACT